jgi:uncharacterized protein YidB (DUF937 family)
VDTAHVVVGASGTREGLYVSMTRGRRANTAYAVTGGRGGEVDAIGPEQARDGGAALAGVLRRTAAEPSAHQAQAAQAERWGSIAQVAAEYETIARAGTVDYWAGLVKGSGWDAEQAERVIASETFPVLIREFQRAQDLGVDPEALVCQIAPALPRCGCDLADRLHCAIVSASAARRGFGPRHQGVRWIVGLIPEPTTPMAPDMRTALDQRKNLIEDRARAIVANAIQAGEPWIAELGPVPRDTPARRRWVSAATTLAACRDRWGITTPDALGTSRALQSDAERADCARAKAAIASASQAPTPPPAFGIPQSMPGVERPVLGW